MRKYNVDYVNSLVPPAEAQRGAGVQTGATIGLMDCLSNHVAKGALFVQA